MKTKRIFIATTLILSVIAFSSCSKKEGCTDPLANNYDADADKDDGSCTYNATTGKLSFSFTHNFDGTPVSNTDFNQFNYINQNGDTLSLTKLRYLISDIRLYTSTGDSILIEGYKLVDVTNNTGLSWAPADDIPFGSYTGISFIFGFDSLDNTGNYVDLNSATWNWPAMLGGGYHFMQMEGKYRNNGSDSLYAYHMGTARPSMGVFEQNYFKADLGAITISNNANIEIKMNIAEWYKNPNTWVLNDFHSTLMPNYTAQIMMNQNGRSVFSLGTVSQ
ncbi:MAG: hypothetical protein KDD29_07290 [Flavobacteriales bacterium]|nr:hypothetical protein [Flavobacteriales bacterium]MCB9335068.1 hypothetical protein [Flavobacteriales bacterium]